MKISQYLDLPGRMLAARTKAGLSQSAIARKLGVSQQSYARYENSIAEPSIEALEIFCREVHMTVPELLGINDPGTGNPPITHFSQWLYVLKELENLGISIDYDVENVRPGSMTGVYRIDQTQMGTIALVLKDLHNKLQASQIDRKEYNMKIDELIKIYNVPIFEYIEMPHQNSKKSILETIKTTLLDSEE